MRKERRRSVVEQPSSSTRRRRRSTISSTPNLSSSSSLPHSLTLTLTLPPPIFSSSLLSLSLRQSTLFSSFFRSRSLSDSSSHVVLDFLLVFSLLRLPLVTSRWNPFCRSRFDHPWRGPTQPSPSLSLSLLPSNRRKPTSTSSSSLRFSTARHLFSSTESSFDKKRNRHLATVIREFHFLLSSNRNRKHQPSSFHTVILLRLASLSDCINASRRQPSKIFRYKKKSYDSRLISSL